MNRRRALIIAGITAFVLIAIAAVVVPVSVVFASPEAPNNEADYPTLPDNPIKRMFSSGNLSPNGWFFMFDFDTPMYEVRTQVELSTNCSIRLFDAEVQTMSVVCNNASLQSMLELTIVQRYGLYWEQEVEWTSNAIQINPPSWGIDRTDQKNRPLSKSFDNLNWDGTGVDVHIVDTGVFAGHNDFGGRVLAGYDGVKDGKAPNTDCNGHGSHVAGTTAGKTFGFAKNSAIYASRVLGCTGSGSTSGIVSALRWVPTQNTNKRKVINMSLGGGASESFDQAVAAAVTAGVVVVVAAGNDNKDACNTSPAREPTAITVMASDINDVRADFSNFGTCTDIVAPGVSITSAHNTNPSGTNTYSGTSMAAPHVAGVAALVLQIFPSYTPAQVADYIISTSTPGVLSDVGEGSPNKLLYFAPTSTGPSSNGNTPTPTPTPPSNAGTTTKTATVARSAIVYEPSNTGYTTVTAGKHTATMTGPAGTDFDLYLYRKRTAANSWVLVASSTSSARTKSITYTDTKAGIYMYAIRAYSGSGSYTITYTRPN